MDAKVSASPLINSTSEPKKEVTAASSQVKPSPSTVLQFDSANDEEWSDDWREDDIYDINDPDGWEKYEQEEINSSCIFYNHEQYYGPSEEKRTCIWSNGDPFSWTEKTSGISWIGMTGTDSSFVVAQDDEHQAPYGRTQLSVVRVLIMALRDMGVWANTSTATTEFRRRMIAKSASKEVGPFSVVSVAPGTVVENHHGSSYGASHAINFLMEKLKDRSSLTYREIKQFALFALKYLLGPKFDPNKIQVRGSGKRDRECTHDCTFPGPQAVEHLNAIYKAIDADGADPAAGAAAESKKEEEEGSDDDMGY